LNGAGCAAALPIASAEPNNKATNRLVFTDASLGLDLKVADGMLITPHSKYHAPLSLASEAV